MESPDSWDAMSVDTGRGIDESPLNVEAELSTPEESSSEFDSDLGVSDAQRHWDESLQQLEHALFLVLCPVIGRVIGRRVAQNIWIKYVTLRWDACAASNANASFVPGLTERTGSYPKHYLNH